MYDSLWNEELLVAGVFETMGEIEFLIVQEEVLINAADLFDDSPRNH